MDWILDHIWLLLVAAGAIAQWLNRRRGENAEQGDEGRGPGEPALPEADFETAERTRRIQEEIRRKIAERAGGGMPGRLPPPVPQRDNPPPMPELRPVATEQRRQRDVDVPSDRSAMDEVLNRQRRLAEQMTELRLQREATQRATEVVARDAAVAKKKSVVRPVVAAALLDDLRDPERVRRAFVLKEVLGTPVGLR